MPIAPELRHYYRTAEWFAARQRVRERAQNRCEWCDKPNHAWLSVLPGGFWWDELLQSWRDAEGRLGIEEPAARTYATPLAVYVVLTTAHLDHNPANNDLDNLAALCQRCHLVYDGPHHRATARLKRDRETGQLRLELEEEGARC